MKSFLFLLLIWQICQSKPTSEFSRQKRSPYPDRYNGLPRNFEGQIQWKTGSGRISRRDTFKFASATVDKHFAPDVVFEAIKNSIATRNNDEIYAATVLAATQRPKNIRDKIRITDAPEIYTDRRGNKRVRWQKTASGQNKNPKLNGRDMTLGDVFHLNSIFKNSDFPTNIQGKTLFANGQWRDRRNMISQVYFIKGKKNGLKFEITNRNNRVKSTNLINSAKRGYMRVTARNMDFGFSGGIGNPMEFAHYAGRGPARPAAPFADERAFDNCFRRICNP